MRNRFIVPVAALVFSAVVVAQTLPSPLTVRSLYEHGSPVGSPPDSLSWSPDGKHLTYVDDGQVMDLGAGGSSGQLRPTVLVSRQQMAALTANADTEQDRDHRDRYGMSSYIWSPDASHLLFDAQGKLWLYELASGKGRQVGDSQTASGDDPKFSADGRQLAYVNQGGLHVVSLGGDKPVDVNVAPAANAQTTNGIVDWLYEEELRVRSNYFWSPDARRLVYLQMYEGAAPSYPITDWIPTHAVVNPQPYVQPGDPNPAVRVGIVPAAGGQTVWVSLPFKAGADYIPRFGWANSQTVWVEVLTRDHKHRSIYFADATTGVATLAVAFDDAKFFDDVYDVAAGDGALVLTNWTDGHQHLYLYRYDQQHPAAARLERQLTTGNFEVGDVYRVDTQAGRVVYASNEGNRQQQQIWTVDFMGHRQQLSSGAGYHEATFAATGLAFADKFSSRTTPTSMRLCKDAACASFWQSHGLDGMALRMAEPIVVKAKDGTELDATLLLPASTATASVPLIVNPYGGPGTQTVADQWKDGLLWDNILAQHGFAVLHVDNRGMGHRGQAFAQACYHNFGPVQLEDQLTAVDAVLARYPQLDGKRLGWWGWSWGGTFTLYAMSHSDRFKAGVSVAPVTDWRNYDSTYTERYMSQPSEFPSGYHDFSVVNSAASLHGHLLLVHGTGDDNVHMENTIQYIQALIEADKPYDLQLYPRKTHSIAGPDVRTHLFERILAHFEQYLKPTA